jgi:hypothetical protein
LLLSLNFRPTDRTLVNSVSSLHKLGNISSHAE